MQWVVTTGRTVEEARERALDALGIDEADLELEVLDEPRSTLLGLRRTEARVRARVRPTRPRPKIDRRNRRKGGPSGNRRRRSKRGTERRDDDDGDTSDASGDQAGPDGGDRDARSGGRTRRRGRARPPASNQRDAEQETDSTVPTTDDAPSPADPPGAGRTPATAEQPGATDHAVTGREQIDDSDEVPTGATGDSMSDISLDEQEATAVGFVQGLVDAFGVDAEVAAEPVDDEHLEIAVTGEDLGLLVGPRGSTLNAIQELTRTAVAQQHSGRLQGRLRVDVAGYRARRKEALERFATQQAERVKETGNRIALEPMSPPDRKIVHDAINEIDGVRTTSEGEDRRRHVVILPD